MQFFSCFFQCKDFIRIKIQIHVILSGVERSRRIPLSYIFMSGHEYFIYILSNISGTLYIYIGVTSDLERRIFEHKNGLRE